MYNKETIAEIYGAVVRSAIAAASEYHNTQHGSDSSDEAMRNRKVQAHRAGMCWVHAVRGVDAAPCGTYFGYLATVLSNRSGWMVAVCEFDGLRLIAKIIAAVACGGSLMALWVGFMLDVMNNY